VELGFHIVELLTGIECCCVVTLVSTSHSAVSSKVSSNNGNCKWPTQLHQWQESWVD